MNINFRASAVATEFANSSHKKVVPADKASNSLFPLHLPSDCVDEYNVHAYPDVVT